LHAQHFGLRRTRPHPIFYSDRDPVGRQSVAFIGDGGFSMLMAEFATAVKYKLPIKVIVINNNTLAMIKWQQMVMDGNPEFGTELSPIDYADFARACGGKGYRIEDPEICGDILEEALREPGPVSSMPLLTHSNPRCRRK
jgi:pyruvate dehydrogenase (quinone)